jgi:menaquinone C8-methyltransferase
MATHRADYLTLRHLAPARWGRALLSRALGGREAWPLVFRAPDPGAELPQGTSANVYVHLPFCEHLCPHCPYNRVIFQSGMVRDYGRALERELAAYLRRGDAPPVRTLYFGGGTPSLTPALIERIVTMVRPHLARDAEIGVEVHPRDAKPSLLGRLRGTGVNRVSLGIETLRPDLLRWLGRHYTPAEGLEAISRAQRHGFEFVDVNLIHGIPGQRADEAIADAERVAGLGVDQVSAYPLFGFAHTPFGRRGGVGPTTDGERLRAQRGVSRVCRAAGLERTSVWSFTRAGMSPYSTVTHEDYVGFGAGAGTKVGGVFWFNTFSILEYNACLEPRPALVLRVGERLRRLHWLYWAIYGTHIKSERYRALFGQPIERDFGRLLLTLQLAGFARRDATGWEVTERGAIWVHRLQSLFSLSYIDELWMRCRHEAWPQEVALV